jgi:AcrR family transcriptional regulator
MTPTPARLLKPIADNCPSCPSLSPKDEKRRAHILETARDSFLQYGFRQITIPMLAYATGCSQTTIRRQYGDLENLLGIVLRTYLDSLIKAVAAIPSTMEDLFPRRRDAYLQATRGFTFAPTPMHFCLVQDRFFLAADLLQDIDMLRGIVGRMLGGEEWEATLNLLDTPSLSREKIENALAGLHGQPPRQATEPEQYSAAAAAQPDSTPAPEPVDSTVPVRATLFARLRAEAALTQEPQTPPDREHTRERTMFPRMSLEDAARSAIRTMDPILGAMRDEDLRQPAAPLIRPGGMRPNPVDAQNARPTTGTHPPPQPADAVLLDSLPLQRMSPASPQVRPHAA